MKRSNRSTSRTVYGAGCGKKFSLHGCGRQSDLIRHRAGRNERAQRSRDRRTPVFQLACRAFQHTAHYDAAISSYLSEMTGQSELPDSITFSMAKEQHLRYGENPHQNAALYGTFGRHLQKLHGKELSFNNILDINAAVMLCAEFAEPTVAIIKHNNPCGVASGASLAEAYSRAFSTDKASAYGGIVCVNRPLDRATAEAINEIFTEVIIAPEYEPGVLELLTKRKTGGLCA